MGNTIQIKRGTAAGSTLADGELGLVRTSTVGNEELYVGNEELSTAANVKVGGYQVGQFDGCISITTNSDNKKEITTSSNAIPIFSSPIYLGNNFALKVVNGSDTANTGTTSITPGVQNFEGTPVISVKAEYNDDPSFALGIGTHPTLVEGENKIVIGNIDAIEVGADSIVCLDTCALSVEGTTTFSGTTSIATPLDITPTDGAAVLQATGQGVTLNIAADGGVTINGVNLNTIVSGHTSDIEDLDGRIDILEGYDFIVDQSLSDSEDIWNYVKWNSGKLEQWGKFSKTTAINTTWGNLYRSDMFTISDYAISFKENTTPVVTYTPENGVSSDTVMCSLCQQGTNVAPPSFYFIRGQAFATSQAFKINIHAIGKWK